MRNAVRTLMAVVVAAMLFAAVGPAEAAASRVALVIGNSTYQHAPPLTTPANDAQDVAATLTRLGFDVVLKQNAGVEELRQTLRDFADKSTGADISMVYFAGYAVGTGTDGFLVPVDADISTTNAFQTQTAPIQSALLDVAKAKLLGMVLLDAMRGNPFKADAPAHPDAVAIDAPATTPTIGTRNVLVFFASEPGKKIVESSVRNSAFSKALVKYLPARDLEVSFLFRNVRDDVREATHQKQTPYMYGQLSREKIFINDVAALKQASLAASARGDTAAAQPCDKLAASPDDTKRTRGVSGVRLEDINADQAVTACTDAAKQYPGVDRFHYQLGRSLYAAKNYQGALESYRRAYELGNTRALLSLGEMYDEGLGVEKDPARARFYYEMGAQAQFAPTIERLARLYERGFGTQVDLPKAVKLYQQAADLGDARALNRLGYLNEKGIAVEANAKQARTLYEKSANLGFDEAMVNLARCYVSAIGGKQDPREARRWLTKAAQAGSADAKRILASVDGPKAK